MDKSKLESRIEDFDDTASVCGRTPQDPEDRLTLLYEDFAVDMHSFFHHLNLDVLLRTGTSTPEIKVLCLTIPKQADYLTQHPDPVEQIKRDRR